MRPFQKHALLPHQSEKGFLAVTESAAAISALLFTSHTFLNLLSFFVCIFGLCIQK